MAESRTYILNTLTALKAPDAHCFLYLSSDGCNESANFPMIGIVHVAPGKCAFLYLYTDCSRTRRAATTANEVYNHDDPASPGLKKSVGIGNALRGDAMSDGKEIDADWCVAFAIVNELDNNDNGDGGDERTKGD